MTSLRTPLTRAAICAVLSACSPLPPQARLDYTAPATEAEFDRLSAREERLGAAQRDRLSAIRQEQARQAAKLRTWRLETDDAPLLVGYGGKMAALGYVLQAGQVTVLDSELGLTPLKAPPKGLFDLRLLPGHDHLLIGRAARGLTLWKLKPPYESLLLEANSATFTPGRIMDVELIKGETDALAMIRKSGPITLYSLRFGAPLKNIGTGEFSPRVLARDTTRDAIIFGTSHGEIVHGETVLYRHSGPVLDAVVDTKTETLASSAKDGSVIGWSLKDSSERFRFDFSTPVYRLERLEGTSLLAIIPVKGRPRVINLETGQQAGWIYRHGTHQITGLAVSAAADLLLIQIGDRKAKLISLPDLKPLATLHPPKGGKIVATALADSTDSVYLADRQGKLWRYRIDAAVSPQMVLDTSGISAIALNAAQSELLVGLVDGTLLTLSAGTRLSTPLRFDGEANQ